MTSPSISKDTPVASAAAAATVVIAAPARPDTRVVRRSELVGWVTAGPAVRVVEAIGRPPCSGGPRWAAHPLHERAHRNRQLQRENSLGSWHRCADRSPDPVRTHVLGPRRSARQRPAVADPALLTQEPRS